MTKQILVVEDSSAMRRLISSILEEMGEEEYEVVETQNGFEALKILPRHKFSLVLLDINMPDINGLELLSFLKSNPQYQSIPAVVISTEGKEEDQRRGLALGADEYLVKPFEPEKLMAVVRRLLKE